MCPGGLGVLADRLQAVGHVLQAVVDCILHRLQPIQDRRNPSSRLSYHVGVEKYDSSEAPFTLTLRVERDIYSGFERLCHARSLEMPDAIRRLLDRIVQDGTLVRVLHTSDDDRGCMPYGLIKDMLLAVPVPRKVGRARRIPRLVR